MPAVSHCPRCTALVSLPGGIDPSARVRCPLCEEEFPLREALDKAPPELIVVDRSPSSAPSPRATGSVDTTADSDGNDRQTVTVEDTILPETLPVTSLDWDDAPPSPEPAPCPASTGEAVQTPGDSFETIDEPFVEIPFEPPSAALADPSFSLPGELPFEPIGRSKDRASAIAPRRSPSALRTMVGIAGGGVCGLAIGYLVLLWIGGPSKDFLKVGSDLPPFLVPSSFHIAGADRDTLPLVAAGSSTTGGTQPRSATSADPLSGDGTASGDGIDASDEIASQSDHGVSTPQAESPGTDETAADALASSEGVGRSVSSESAPPIIGGPTYSPDDLAEALESARKAQPALVTGTLADRATRRAKAKAYRTFSRLAEVTTFVRSHDSGTEIEPYRRAVANLVLDSAQVGSTFEQLALIGEKWLAARNRSGRGALLAGDIESIRQHGDHYVIRLRTAGGSARQVLCGERPEAKEGEQVVVLGAVESEPATHITGYSGPQEMVVWAGQIVPVPRKTGR
ncbi:MAG: hypothetical protein ACC645_03205 [Pirellulales bacterium]